MTTASQQSWIEVELGDVCEFAYGKSLPATERSGSGFPVFGSNGPVGLHENALTNGETIIVGRKGSFGEVHYSRGPCSPIDTTYYITENQTEAFLPWLARRLRCLGLDKLNRAAAIPGLNRTDAYRQRLLLPPLTEQKRIAAILDAADTLRAKRNEALAQLDTLLKSTFLNLFGNLESFDYVKVEDLAADKRYSLASGPFGSSLTSKHYVEDGVLVLRGLNISSGELDLRNCKYVSDAKAEELKRSAVHPNDIVIVAVGSSGQAFLIPHCFPRAVLSQNFNKISPNESKVHPVYLVWALNSPIVQRQFSKGITDTVRTFLSLTKVKAVNVPVPPLDLQQRFVAFVESVQRQKARMRAHLAELDALFASLQSRAFNGEL